MGTIGTIEWRPLFPTRLRTLSWNFPRGLHTYRVLQDYLFCFYLRKIIFSLGKKITIQKMFVSLNNFSNGSLLPPPQFKSGSKEHRYEPGKKVIERSTRKKKKRKGAYLRFILYELKVFFVKNLLERSTFSMLISLSVNIFFNFSRIYAFKSGARTYKKKKK